MFVKHEASIAELQRLKRERKSAFDKAQALRKAGRSDREVDALIDKAEQLTADIVIEQRHLDENDRNESYDFEPTEGRGFVDVKTGQELRTIRNGDVVSDGGLSLGRMLRASATGDWSRAIPEMEALRAQGSASGATGGFAVPEIVSRNIWARVAARSGVMRAGGTIIECPTGDTRIAQVTGVNSVGVIAENDEILANAVTFGSVNLRPYKYATRVPVSIELMSDAPNVEQALEKALIDALAESLDTAATSGTGSEEPRGLLAWTTGGTDGNIPSTDLESASVTWNHLISAYWTLMGRSVPETAVTVVTNPAVMSALDQLLEGETGGYLRSPKALERMKFITSPNIPAPSDSSIIVGDFSNVVVGSAHGLDVRWVPQDARHYQYNLIIAHRMDIAPMRLDQFQVLENVGIS